MFPKQLWNMDCAALWRIFHQIKVCTRIGRKDSIQAVSRNMRRLEAFLFCISWFGTLNSSQKFKIKILKFKTYPGPILDLSNGTTLRLIYYGRTVPLHIIDE